MSALPKLDALRASLREMQSVLVCYSGGIDSAFVLAVATEELGERERGHRLKDRGDAGGERDRHQQIRAPLADDIVDEELGRGRQHQAGEAADQHHREAER